MGSNYTQYNHIAELLKALSHPVRICIVRNLLEKGECNVSFMQSCLDTPQSTVSQHLAKLKGAGIIEARREGLEVFYRVSSKKAADIIKILTEENN